MSETRLVKQILKVLREQGGWWIKTHGGLFQSSGLPDLLGCYRGRFIGIEIKVLGKKPTKIQENIIQKIIKAGGIAGVATSVDEALDVVRRGKYD